MNTQQRKDILPSSLPPRAVTREEAARYLAISASTFDLLVKDGRMPKPKLINTKPVWDVKALDRAFDALPDSGAACSDLDFRV
jgi:predicted DNA-binding transcriptional regulator AlpA